MQVKIVNWIKSEVKQAGAKGIVMGLSGGLDSSVVAALSKKAVGQDKLLAVIMPCHSHFQDIEDAKLVGKKLGIKIKIVDLSNIYDAFIKIMPKAGGIAMANLKARFRMAVLYFFANKFNYLVCGTGNKSEIKVGYFTKHGDGATDILPIGGLLKREVRSLAVELGIPRRIVDKAPSAGLWLGQTDEAEMGLTYAELDDILERMQHNKKQVLPSIKVEKVKRMIKRSEHKRQGPRICTI